jgi:hypothetical protein
MRVEQLIQSINEKLSLPKVDQDALEMASKVRADLGYSADEVGAVSFHDDRKNHGGDVFPALLIQRDQFDEVRARMNGQYSRHVEKEDGIYIFLNSVSRE